ncbi:TOM1-like protein 5 [Phragmites australis]|uniref:TOM1-like protein 5 n=1 Tax=Phragmites australis TaxID=29695 RepID=UPI002D797832|nr:TOM1-like protein 5 [Phragmites australis]
MTSEMVKAATSEKLKEMDWAKNIEICELVAQDPGKAKDVIKSIKKCIGSRSKNTQLYAVMLLEMLMNNCGEPIHRQVIDNGLLPILVKIVKKKTELPVREKIFLLLDATQTSLGGAKAKFPQYYEAYYDLVSAGVQFSNRPNIVVTRAEVPVPETRTEPNKDGLSSRLNEGQREVHTQPASDTSIIRKATSVMEVLRDVLNSVDPRHPEEGATDEFVLDLVEQCTFQKQRIMHLVMTSRDDLVVSQAIELNEELHMVLVRHDALLSVQPTTTLASNLKEEEEEEDAESLYRRLRKGKALSQDYQDDTMPSFRSIPEDKMRRPLIIQPPQPEKKLGALNIRLPNPEPRPEPAPLIPPPPAKHAERERFFREKSTDGVTNLPDHLRGLSLHSRDGSSSCSGSTDYGD